MHSERHDLIHTDVACHWQTYPGPVTETTVLGNFLRSRNIYVSLSDSDDELKIPKIHFYLGEQKKKHKS